MEKDYYVLLMHLGFEPYLYGPFDTSEKRDEEAKNRKNGDKHGIFPLEVEKGREIDIGCYSGSFFDNDLSVNINKYKEQDNKLVKVRWKSNLALPYSLAVPYDLKKDMRFLSVSKDSEDEFYIIEEHKLKSYNIDSVDIKFKKLGIIFHKIERSFFEIIG